MKDWERLTPEGTDPIHTIIEYTYDSQRVLPFRHRLWQDRCDMISLSDAELLALACKSPEVQTLVEALREREWTTVGMDASGDPITLCVWCAQLKNVGHSSGCVYVKTLTPFEGLSLDNQVERSTPWDTSLEPPSSL